MLLLSVLPVAPDASNLVVLALSVSREVESMASGGGGGNEKWRVRMRGEGEERVKYMREVGRSA